MHKKRVQSNEILSINTIISIEFKVLIFYKKVINYICKQNNNYL